MSNVLSKAIIAAVINVSLTLVSITLVQAQDPIHHWSLDNSLSDTGTIGGLDLELAGGTGFSTDGDAGLAGQAGSLTINGTTNAFARAANHGEPFVTDMTHSVTLWARHDDISSTQRWISWGSCCIPGGPDFNQRYFAGPHSGQLQIGYFDSGSSLGPLPTQSVWEHWAFVRDLGAETLTLYRNGTLVNSTIMATQPTDILADNGNPSDTTHELRLGNQFDDTAAGIEPMTGRLSDVAIFDVALDLNQITTIMQNGAGEGSGAPPTNFEWRTNNGLGDWNSTSNWTFSGGPNSNEHTAVLGGMTSQTTTVVTNSDVTLNSIQFDSSNQYIVAGGGNLNLAANSAGAAGLPTINVVQGTHEFQARVVLGDDTTIAITSGATIEFNNDFSLGGNTLTKAGSGILSVNNKLEFDGGTIEVQSGALAGEGSTGATVVNNSVVSPGAASASGNLVGVVPEPAGLALMAFGVSALIISRRQVKRIQFVLAIAFTTLLLIDSPAFGQILSGNEPDPTFNGNAMQLWLRGGSGVTESGGSVSSWADLSTHGNDAVQDSGLNQPTVNTFLGTVSSRDVIQFANPGGATDQWLDTGTNLQSTWAGSFTVFSLIAPNDGIPPVDNVWFGINDNSFTTRWWGNVAPALANPGGTIDMIYRPNSGQASTLFQPAGVFSDGPQSEMKLLTIRVNDSANTLELFVDGASPPEFTGGLPVDNSQFTAPNSTVFIGAGSGTSQGGTNVPWIAFDGAIAEMIIYQGALSNPDLAAVEDYILNFGSVTSTETTFEWRTDNGFGDWTANTNWTFSGVPNGAEHTAILGSMTSQTTTVVNNADITVNSIQVDNSNSYIVAGAGRVNMVANSAGAAGLPTINVVQGTHEFQARVSLSDDTTIDIGDGATIEFNNRLSLNGNTLNKNGSGILAVNNKLNFGGGSIQVQSGTLGGDGSTGAAVVNAASVAPGSSPGTLTVDGTYDQTAGGTLEIELASDGGLPGTDYDRLMVTGAATLDGTIDMQFDAGYTPTINDAFSGVLTAMTLGGTTFATVSNAVINGRLGVAVTYTGTSVDAAIALRGNTDVDSGDVDVDTSDLTTSIINFTSAAGTGKTWAEGDMDGDGDVDTSDLTTSIINFTSAMGAKGSLHAAAVPEPGGVALLILGLFGLLLSGGGRISRET